MRICQHFKNIFFFIFITFIITLQGCSFYSQYYFETYDSNIKNDNWEIFEPLIIECNGHTLGKNVPDFNRCFYFKLNLSYQFENGKKFYFHENHIFTPEKEKKQLVQIGSASYSVDSLLVIVDSVRVLNNKKELITEKQISDTMYIGNDSYFSYMKNHYDEQFQFHLDSHDNEIYIQALTTLYKIDNDSCLKTLRVEFLMTPTKLKSFNVGIDDH